MNRVDQHPHEPVLLEETVSRLVSNEDGVYLDCTIGFGGHSSKILDKLSKSKMNCTEEKLVRNYVNKILVK